MYLINKSKMFERLHRAASVWGQGQLTITCAYQMKMNRIKETLTNCMCLSYRDCGIIISLPFLSYRNFYCLSSINLYKSFGVVWCLQLYFPRVFVCVEVLIFAPLYALEKILCYMQLILQIRFNFINKFWLNYEIYYIII